MNLFSFFDESCEVIVKDMDHNTEEKMTENWSDYYFRRAHSITVLLGMLAALLYVAVVEDVRLDTEFNTKR